MAKVSLVPSSQNIFNDFDRDGLLLGLPRLAREKNADYKRRLEDVFVHRGGPQYINLIYAITRELGLEIIDALNIKPVFDSNGNPLVPFPAVIFAETKCYLYNDYSTGDVLLELDRFEKDGGAFTLEELVDQINGTGLYTATLLVGAKTYNRSMSIFNQSSIVSILAEDISSSGVRIHLANRNIIPDTVVLNSANVFHRVNSQVDIRREGDYYLDRPSGILYTYSAPAPGSVIRYKARKDDFTVEASPVVIHNLQSADFQTKMFERTEDDDNGKVTQVGADIINELLSVFPFGYGK